MLDPDPLDRRFDRIFRDRLMAELLRIQDDCKPLALDEEEKHRLDYLFRFHRNSLSLETEKVYFTKMDCELHIPPSLIVLDK